MSPMTRSVRFGILLVSLGQVVHAQEHRRGARPGHHHPGGAALPGVGFGLGIVGNVPFVGGSSYRPNLFNPSSTGIGLAMNPAGFLPPGQEGPGGLMLPHLGSGIPGSPVPSTRKTNPARAEELLEVGDRSFRGGNFRRAEERYLLAIKADPESPFPHVHLAQIALARSNYTKAAAYLREAVAATERSGWLLEARDIQAMYGEPGDFAKQIAQLESYLQSRPSDRNAWFVLGAQQYFSGRSQAAADAFLRLSDQPPDLALSAFRDASIVAIRSTPQSGSSR